MSLPPKYYVSHVFPGSIKPVNTVELYVDYACKFSAKIFKIWYNEIYPELKTAKYQDNVQILFRHYVQTWHPNSTMLHESGLAVSSLQPEIFLKFSYKLFDEIEQFYDSETVDLTRNQIYEKVYKVVIEGDSEYKFSKEEFLNSLVISKADKPNNDGNSVTNDLKYFTKVGRQNGVHVTPTVLINGFKDPSIESSTSPADILKKFDALL